MDTNTATAVPLSVRLILGDTSDNAYVQTVEIPMIPGWKFLNFYKGNTTVGPTQDFTDAGNGAAFRWDRVTSVKFVLMDTSPTYANAVNGTVYIGQLEGITPTPTTVTQLGDLQDLADGSLVTIAQPQIAISPSTAFADGSFYIEAPNRTTGIKVVPNGVLTTPVNVGDKVALSGLLSTDASYERYIQLTSINSQSAGSSLGALGAGDKALSVVASPVMTGLLATIWGRVTHSEAGFMYVDDGSGFADGNTQGYKGIMVNLSGMNSPVTKDLSDLPFVSVTGPVGIAFEDTGIVLVVQPRSDADVTVY